MKRDLAYLASQRFDLLVIGGGVVGACVARDAARRGLATALIEQEDFACAASEAMSRTIHGGIRYLAAGQMALVRSGLKEQAIWRRIAPDFIAAQDWLVPHYGAWRDTRNRFGAALYQWIAGRGAKHLSRREALDREPVLEAGDLTGASVYQDYHVAEPHRLVIALLEDAEANGAVMANHALATALTWRNGRVAGATALDRLSEGAFDIRANMVVNATGPWAQVLAGTLLPGQGTARVIGSKGIHIIVPGFTRQALALSGAGEHGFVVPWQGLSLIGTTDDRFDGEPFGTQASDAEVTALRDKIIRLLPAARTHLDRVVGCYAGVRALPGAGTSTYGAAREALLADHAADGADGFFTLTGGKWTTARLMAEQVVDRIGRRLGGTLKPCDTGMAAISGGESVPALSNRLRRAGDTEMAVTPDDFRRRVGRHRRLADPGVDAAIDDWLESAGIVGNSKAGRAGRQA